MNKLLFLILFVETLFSYESVHIKENSVNISVLKELYCTEESSPLSVDEIFQNKELTALKKSNIGFKTNAFWCRLQIQNDLHTRKSIVLFNPRSGMDYIDAYIYQKDTLKLYKLGDMRPMKNRSLPSLYSNILLDLEANEQITLIYKAKSVGNIELMWKLQTIDNYIYNESLNTVIISIYFGFLIALMMYKLFIYYSIKDKLYLIYVGLIFSNIISQATIQGSFYYLFNGTVDYFTITITNWISTHFFLVFLWIFTFYFFNFKKASKLYYTIIVIIVYNIGVVLFYSYAYIDVSVLTYTPLMIYIAILESILLLIVSLKMFIQKAPGSGYFLVGHTLYLITIFVYIMAILGIVKFTLISNYITSIGVLLVISFMSFSLSSRFKTLKEENDYIKREREKNNKYTLIGTTIAYIVHQWKQPLTVVSAQIASIQAQIDFNPNKPIKSIENKVLAVEGSILNINTTITEIKKLFTANDFDRIDFNIQKSIKEVQQLLADKIKAKSIQIIAPENLNTIYGNTELFTHVMTNIIDNSIDAFNTDTENNIIKISSYKSKKTFFLSIEDNAGGITIEPINLIFEPNITNKSYGSGIGLAIVKNIIESKFNGSVEVEKVKNGSKFTIIIPL